MAQKLDPVINPIDGEKVKGDVSRYVRKLRRARAGSRRMMRSGNPAVRAQAAVDNAAIPEMIRDAYRDDFSKRDTL